MFKVCRHKTKKQHYKEVLDENSGEYSIDFTNIAELIMILLSISPGTSPLERSYSKLTKRCYKDRARTSTETLEIL